MVCSASGNINARNGRRRSLCRGKADELSSTMVPFHHLRSNKSEPALMGDNFIANEFQFGASLNVE